VAIAGIPSPLSRRNRPEEGRDLPQVKVDAAIQNGIQFLWKNIDELKPVTIHGPTETGEELLLLAFLRGGLAGNGSPLPETPREMLERKLLKTYSVSIRRWCSRSSTGSSTRAGSSSAPSSWWTISS
jgi:hypothetical protein